MPPEWLEAGEEPVADIHGEYGYVQLTVPERDCAMSIHRWRRFLERRLRELNRWDREHACPVGAEHLARTDDGTIIKGARL